MTAETVNLPAEEHAWLRDLAWLRRLARTLADEHDAEDAVQDTVVAVLKGGPDDRGSRRPWLATVLRNFVLRAHRRRDRRTARERGAARGEALPSAAALVERVHFQRGVGEAVVALDEPYRTTILLRFFEDLPPRAIARQLGVPVNTVRTRVQRGLAMLRARLDREHGSRAAWAPMCLPLLKAGATTAAAGSILSGVLLMSTGHKLTLALAAILVAALPLAVLQPWAAGPERNQGNEPGVAGPVAASATGPATVAPTPAEAGPGQRTAVVDGVPRITLCGELVDDRNGQPVAAAQVILAHRFARKGDEPHGVSDQRGRFAVDLPKQPAMPADLLVEARDYAPFHDWLPRQEILAASAERYDLGTLRLPRGALVTGRVVRTADGAAVAGALLSWTDESPQDGTFLPNDARAAGTSAADGTFTLRDRLPPTPEWDHTLFAAGPEGLGWARLAIARDCDHAEVTIEVPDTGSLRVHVTDAGGQALGEARVQALPWFAPIGPSHPWQHGSWIGPDPQWTALFVVKTDADGNGVLPKLPHGRYRVSATHAGHHPVGQEAEIEARRETAVTLEMPAVVAVTIHGRVLDRNREPVAGATITRRPGPDQLVAVRTDADGAFRLGPVQMAGSLHFEATADGYGIERRTVDLAQFDPSVPVEIVLDPVHTVSGRIVDQDGQPVAGANPFLRHGGAIADPAGAPKTGVDGTFTVKVVAAADQLELQAMPPEPRQGSQPGPVVVVPAGNVQGLELRLHRPVVGHATLRVRVTALDGATPVEPQYAHLFPAAGTLEEGMRFSIPTEVARGLVTAGGLAPGDYELGLRAAGGGRTSTTFHVGPEERPVELHLAIGPPARIVGRVVFDGVPPELRTGKLWFVVWPHCDGHQLGADGKPVPGLTDGSVMVDAAGDGRFVLGDLPMGEPLELRLADHAPLMGSATIAVPAGGEGSVELRLQVGARVRFTSNAPVPAGSYRIEVATGDGAFRTVHSEWHRHAGPLEVEVLLSPGPFRWRLTGRVAEVAEAGRAVTAAGEAIADRSTPCTVTIAIGR